MTESKWRKNDPNHFSSLLYRWMTSARNSLKRRVNPDATDVSLKSSELCYNQFYYYYYLPQAEELVSKFFPQKIEELQMLLKVST